MIIYVVMPMAILCHWLLNPNPNNFYYNCLCNYVYEQFWNYRNTICYRIVLANIDINRWLVYLLLWSNGFNL